MLNTEESRKGAMACLSALQIIEHFDARQDSNSGRDSFWRKKDAACSVMLLEAGEQSAFITGFIAAVAEYVGNIQLGSIPDPYAWKPEAAMTDEEKAANRAYYAEETA